MNPPGLSPWAKLAEYANNRELYEPSSESVWVKFPGFWLSHKYEGFSFIGWSKAKLLLLPTSRGVVELFGNLAFNNGFRLYPVKRSAY